MRIAIVGTGISGLVAAHLLYRDHDLTIYEAEDYVGGHTRTIDVGLDSGSFAVDTGFVVFNEITYPNFVSLLTDLGVDAQPTSMSFSVKCERSGVEYCGTSLNTVFAQRRNLLRPSFHRMLIDIARFNRASKQLLRQGLEAPTLGAYLTEHRYSRAFVDHYIIPMGAALWSADPARVLEFPSHFFLRFLANHGLLNAVKQLDWLVIKGGSARYVDVLIRPFSDRIRLSTPVRGITRSSAGVMVSSELDRTEHFDHVIIATHSDQALAMLRDPSDTEFEILEALPYQRNAVVLHTNASVLPRCRRAWASWNYLVPRQPRDTVAVTYNMNRLQGIERAEPFCVSLNPPHEIPGAKVMRAFQFQHPVYTVKGVQAQQRHAEISGVRNTHFCGAYWGNGFHEDGVNSALAVGRFFGRTLKGT